LAWCCTELGINCTVFTPEHAPEIKVNAIESYGATVVKVTVPKEINIV
jgi:threonine dehydratase